MKNATMLYKHPGRHEIHGDFFDFIIVDEDEVAKTKKEGWSLTTDEAKAKAKNKKKKESEELAADPVAEPSSEGEDEVAKTTEEAGVK